MVVNYFNKLMRIVDLFLAIFVQQIKARMSYREDFFISLIGLFVFNFVGLISLDVLLSNVQSINGWGYGELVFAYSFVLLSTFPSQLLCDNLWALGEKLKDGSFINYYLKPMDILFYFLSEKVDVKAFGQLLIALVAMKYSLSVLNVELTVWLSLKIVFWVICSSFIMAGLMLFASSIGFWVIDPTFALIFVNKLREVAHFPFSIYPTYISIFFVTAFPIGLLGYLPSDIILHGNGIASEHVIAPLFCVFYFLMSIKLWKFSALRFVGTGS